MDLLAKLAILADAAKYDASCASSGAGKRDSRGKAGVGSTTSMGICHSYTPDGRCVSLLKILLTNFCIYDCQYCINRRSSDVPRARLLVSEVVKLTIDFYRRNYIEGLFLSSGIIRTPDYTMEQLVEVARRLREEEQFRGYIHLKTIPDADPLLIARAGELADRLSINIELPTASSLQALAPEKDLTGIKRGMARIHALREERRSSPTKKSTRQPRFVPAGQSTQLIVGADQESDKTILTTATSLYASYGLKRVYYSAYSPIPDASPLLPAQASPLLREHRLYQADWLVRFYGFTVDDIAPTGHDMLSTQHDPKLAWALRHPEYFPVDINRAPKHRLLRVPGLGVRSINALLTARRWTKLTLADLARLRVPLNKARDFIITADHHPDVQPRISVPVISKAAQLDLFA